MNIRFSVNDTIKSTAKGLAVPINFKKPGHHISFN